MTTGATMFSGGGVAEALLKNRIDIRWAIEYDPAIAAVYCRNIGDHIIVGDVRHQDYGALGSVDWLHASPVCTRASVANSGAGAAPDRRGRGRGGVSVPAAGRKHCGGLRCSLAFTPAPPVASPVAACAARRVRQTAHRGSGAGPARCAARSARATCAGRASCGKTRRRRRGCASSATHGYSRTRVAAPVVSSPARHTT